MQEPIRMSDSAIKKIEELFHFMPKIENIGNINPIIKNKKKIVLYRVIHFFLSRIYLA